MLDIHFIRENADLVKEASKKKKIDIDIDRLLAIDEERKSLRAELDAKRAEQNRMSGTIARADGAERLSLIESMRHVKEGMVELDEKYAAVMKEW